MTQPDTRGICTCEGTYAVTFCKDCGIGMDTQALALARVNAEIKRIERTRDWAFASQGSSGAIGLEEQLCFLRALRKAIEMCAPNGYTTWDTSMVPMVDGHYDPTETEKWELAHGHDIRLKCYPEFGCQLLIDPEDLLTEIAKELNIR